MRLTHEHFMQGLTVQHLRFVLQPTESIVFGPQPGSALRGALYQTLSDSFCSDPCGENVPDHTAHCPVCWLLAAEDETAARGRDVPRALTVEPPPPQTYHQGDTLTFGLTLIGQAQNLFPYLARAVQNMGGTGVGKGRGRFRLASIVEYNPLTDGERSILEQNLVRKPVLQITPEEIARAVAAHSSDGITIEFITPLRLTAQKQLVKTPDPVVFVQRLVERCQRIAECYAETDTPPPREDWYQLYQHLTAAASEVEIAQNYTEWVEVQSGSQRQGRYTPISGLVGTAQWRGPLQELIPWLLWGQSLHVGKNAVKGDGWYKIRL